MIRLLSVACCLVGSVMAAEPTAVTFRNEVAPILIEHCVRCHAGDESKGDVDLSMAATVVEGRGEGWLVVPGEPDESYLLEVVAGEKPLMPKAGDPLTADEIAVLRRWIAGGAHWPDDLVLEHDPLEWWSLRPLERPPIPAIAPEDDAWVRNPIDAFIAAELREQGLVPSTEADRRTLIRRLSFNLIGLPPTAAQVERFVANPNPTAYEQLVDRLLASPHYGERWARHWLDVVHYGDTHGYDKDKVRPNAWPYRDYVVRSFNDDKRYARFVREQLAGDRLAPRTADGIVALGFIAAGPFDYVGHIEVKNGTLEKRRVRNIDRDDMVSATMNTFVSLTAQCARCHDHKFDPISQEDYYSLQAVFAAVDRADRPFDVDPMIAKERLALDSERHKLESQLAAVNAEISEQAGPELKAIDRRLAELRKPDAVTRPPEYGYHSAIAPTADHVKWVQIDLGEPVPIARIELVPAYDDYAGIGAGFGFPVRYRLEVSNDPEFQRDVIVIADATGTDILNPGLQSQSFVADASSVRYVRVTATKLAERKNDYIFALAELRVWDADGANQSADATVSAFDSIEAPPRWGKANVVDGITPETSSAVEEIAELSARRKALLDNAVDPAIRQRKVRLQEELERVRAVLTSLPPPQLVYAASTHFAGSGNFQPTAGDPRPVFVLGRGSERSPLYEVGPGTVGCVSNLQSRFELGEQHEEAERRAALANWIVDRRNPLTWRSIVNRIWYYHFGRGIVETPNDFGRMGAEPTHPELLDWLAAEFRDGRQSIKDLHRLILTSATYRQSSQHHEQHARIDAGNRYLWRMNRRRLEAEAIRDAVLSVSGKLRTEMGGPGFRPFRFEDDHSPRYLYREHDPNDPASHRRSIYRFIVRSVPDPFMTTLDCADPSLIVARRNETLTALQALALLNNAFTVRMAEGFAERAAVRAEDPVAQVAAAYRLALQRDPSAEELAELVPLAEEHGLANVCRLLFNANEFLFVD